MAGSRSGWVSVVGLVAVLSVGGGYLLLQGGTSGTERSGGEEPRADLSLVETLGGADTVGYARALEPRPFVFPDDHGPHDDFRSEWWYFTGNLDAADGRRFGFQYTVFRGALAPPGPDSTGAADETEGWSTRQVYLGHFALTDVAGRSFTEVERYTRGSAGLAGARANPFRVWLDDWELTGPTDPVGADPAWPMTLSARDESIGLDLRLAPLKPVVLQGVDGLSQKGEEPGNASFYYSYTRLGAEGSVEVEGESVPVTGLAWLDREWSTSALSEGLVGWDWFALQLSDGRDLMVYQLRRESGEADPRSDGVLVAEDGTVRHLSVDDFSLSPTGRWSSPIDGAVYPSGWRVRVPEEGLDLTVTPVLDDQELDVSFRYWEGAVDIEGTAGGRPVSGRGYVELTGYDG
jgi:predicted secreted hydrolase